MLTGVRDQRRLDPLGHVPHRQARSLHPEVPGLRPALMAAAGGGALQPAQISKKHLEGARALVIAAEGFVSALDCGDVGPDFLSNEIVGSVRLVLAGRDS